MDQSDNQEYMLVLQHINLRHIGWNALCLCLLSFSICLGMFGHVNAERAKAGHPISLIRTDFQQGNISLDEKARLYIQAIKSPDELPAQYLSSQAVSSILGQRGATMALVEIRAAWDQLSDDTKQFVTLALTRRTTQFTYVSPSGFFTLHYDTIWTDAVPTLDADGSGVPDYVEACAAYCDTSMTRHTDLGYLAPPPDNGYGGDDTYDVYFENMGYYGYAVPEGAGPEPWGDTYSYLVLNNNFIGFPANNDPEGNIAGAAKATCAHELHHAVQFTYDYTEPGWFMELDATWFEDIAFDAVDDNYNYLDTFMDFPELALTQNDYHAYSCFIWGSFLAQAFDTSLMVAIWEGARYDGIVSVLEDTLQTRYGQTVDSAFTEFAIWNLLTDFRDDGLHYEEGSSYLPVKIGATHISYPVNSRISPFDPAGYATCYVQFVPGVEPRTLQLDFNGSIARDWATWIVKATAGNNYSFEQIVLDPGTSTGSIEVKAFDTYEWVTLVAVNISEFSSSASFHYSAELIPPHSLESELFPHDSVIYSGDTRMYEYRVVNSSPLQDIFDIEAYSAAGWITQPTISYPIAPGKDTIFQIPVKPPVGTPIGVTEVLYFSVISWGDSLVTDSHSTMATTVMQYGDFNFDGTGSDIVDLTYFIEYLFGIGDEPQPVKESGDFDCQGTVDIVDLTALVEYLFGQGTYPVCNPY